MFRLSLWRPQDAPHAPAAAASGQVREPIQSHPTLSYLRNVLTSPFPQPLRLARHRCIKTCVIDGATMAFGMVSGTCAAHSKRSIIPYNILDIFYF